MDEKEKPLSSSTDFDMTQHRQSNRATTAQSQIDLRHIWSCVAAGAATFIFIGLFWPATSSGLRATTTIDFSLPQNIPSLSKTEIRQLKSVVGQTVANSLSGEAFDALLTQTKRSGSVNSDEIEYRDFESIRNALDLGFAFRPDGGRIEIGFRCKGSPDELRFLQLLGNRLSTAVDRAYLDATNGVAISNELTSDKFERALYLANQLRDDLDEISQQRPMQQVGSNANGATPFQLASSRKIDPYIAGQISADNIRTLAQLLQEVKDKSVTLEDDLTTFDVLNVAPVKTRTIGALPGRVGMFTLIALSTFMGCVVALYPTASLRRFKSVENVSETLGVPVVGVVEKSKVGKSGSTHDETIGKIVKHFIEGAKVFLLIVLLVVIGFSLIDSTIREAMFQNPFDGFAKIFRVFIRYG